MMSFVSAISRVTGLLSILIVARAFGALDYLQDSYNLANVMPNMLFELVAGGILTSIFIPVLVERIIHDREQSWDLASNITTISTIFLVMVAAFGTLFSHYFVRAQTFLVPTKTVDISNVDFFFKFFIWEIVFYGLTAVFNGILVAHKKFAAPAYAPIFNNLVVIATVLFVFTPLKQSNPDLALLSLAVGTTLGIAAMAAIQIPALRSLGWRYRPLVDFSDPAVRKLGILALPVLAYVLSNQIGLTVANALSWKFEGGISAFTYSWRFFQMPYGLLAVSISTVLFPGLSQSSALDDIDSFKQTLGLAVAATAFVMIPVSVYFALLSPETIGLFTAFFGRAGVAQISGVMSLFMVGLLPFSLFMLLNRVFYALQDSRTPMLVNAVGVPLNIALDFALVSALGVAGLALAHSLTYLFTMGLMFWALRGRIGAMNGRALFRSAARFTLISAPAGAIMYLVGILMAGLHWPRPEVGHLAVLAAAGLTGGVVYLALSKVFGSTEVDMLRGIIARRASGPAPEAAPEPETVAEAGE